MSRRTKRIILASFLLLLSATVGTIILTWTATNPLRFQAIELQNASSPSEHYKIWKVRMVVENVSHIPVHLFEAVLRKPRPGMMSRKLYPAFTAVPKPIIGTVEFDPQTVPQSRFSILIPPGQTRECHFYIYHRNDPVQWLQDVDVHYSWISFTASKVDHLRMHLRRVVPEKWRPHIPTRRYERDITPVESDSLPPPVTPVLVKAAPVEVTPAIASPVTASPVTPSSTAPSPVASSIPHAERRRFFTAPPPASTYSPFEAAPPSPTR